MDNRENSRPNIAIERQNEAGKNFSGIKQEDTVSALQQGKISQAAGSQTDKHTLTASESSRTQGNTPAKFSPSALQQDKISQATGSQTTKQTLTASESSHTQGNTSAKNFTSSSQQEGKTSQPTDNQTDKQTLTAYTHTTPSTPQITGERLHPQKSSGGLKRTTSQNEAESESLSLKKTSGTQKLTGTQQTSRANPEPKPASYEPSAKSSTGKWIAGIVIGAVVAVGAWLGYDVYIRPSQKGNIGSEPATVSPEVTSKPDYGKFAQEIFSSLENDYGDYVRAGAIEDYGFCENEEELSQAWRGRNVFMFTGSNAVFIDEWKFSESFANALKPSTLEINDEGTLFNADMSDAQSFRADSLIESAVTLAGSLRPDESNRFSNIQAMKRNITGSITKQLESNSTHGYVRFILKTNSDGAKLMAAYSLDPYNPSARKYLVLSDGFTGFDGRTLRDIEDSINVMIDINVVSFTMRNGRVESHDSLSECLKKFVHSFAK